MSRILITAALLLSLLASHAWADEIRERSDSFGSFGKLHIYMPAGSPKQLTLLVSGDGGWNLGVIDMARSLTELGSMVAGIDISHYIKHLNASREKCVYSAAHFEELSQYLQKKYKFPHYVLPVLVGYSSGATLVYATFAQSPPNTFAGGISLGFCPDLKTARPLCKGSGTLSNVPDPKRGFVYKPASKLAAKLYVLQGDIDQVCSTPDTKKFLSKVNNAQLIELPRVGHGFEVKQNWMPQFKEAFQEIVGSQQPWMTADVNSKELGDLPLIELPVASRNDTLVVMISGDGGWAGIDRQVAETLNRDGFAVVGLNSLQYFWEKKGPDIIGADLTRILDHYSKAWGANKFILVGYSSGADTLPFMTARLPKELRSKVSVVALLGLGRSTNFEFHVSDWLLNEEGSSNVIPEVLKLKGMKVLCIYGEDEGAESGCSSLDARDFSIIKMGGGHHFGGDYDELAKIILQNAK